MPTRPSTKINEAEQINSIAARIAAQTTGQQTAPPPITPPARVKNAAAVALGRLGASKGGVARAEKLTKSERSSIASKAATARWGKKS